MTSIDKLFDLSLRKTDTQASQKEVERQSGARKGFRPVVNDDFVIPHVGSKISDQEVVSFAEGLAGEIAENPYRAVGAQANQKEIEVKDLTR
jgi:hypothetical protein